MLHPLMGRVELAAHVTYVSGFEDLTIDFAFYLVRSVKTDFWHLSLRM